MEKEELEKIGLGYTVKSKVKKKQREEEKHDSMSEETTETPFIMKRAFKISLYETKNSTIGTGQANIVWKVRPKEKHI